jgi:Flp pilus assembly protein TadD
MQPNHAMTERRQLSLIVAGIVAAIVAAFFGVVHCEFVHLDDTTHVFGNELVKSGLSLTGMKHAFTEPHALLWVPLTTISFMADVSLFGMNPMAMHIENVLWHAAAASFLFLALRNFTGRTDLAAVVALLFGIHPINVESIAWVTERKNVLCGFLFMLALFAWSHWTRARNRRAWFAALFSFAAALLAKPMAVTFPFVLVLLDIWPLRRFHRGEWKQLALEKAPLFFLSVVASFIAARVASGQSNVGLDVLPIGARIANALSSYGHYLTDLVWPTKLAVFYPHPWTAQWTPALITLGAISCMFAFAIRLWKQRPYLLIGGLIFMGMLVPNLGLVQVGWQARADRFTYFAQIGVFIAVVWLADSILPHLRSIRIALSSAVIAALTAVSIVQVSVWENSLTLFQHAAETVPNNSMALENLGYAYARTGKETKAIESMEASLRIQPVNFACWNELGAAHMRTGKPEIAARDFRNALSLKPTDTLARCNLATATAAAGDTASAEKSFREIIAAEPDFAEAHLQYGLLLGFSGRTEDARARLGEALRLSPDNPAISGALQRLR